MLSVHSRMSPGVALAGMVLADRATAVALPPAPTITRAERIAPMPISQRTAITS
jgi:hypothetical protein